MVYITQRDLSLILNKSQEAVALFDITEKIIATHPLSEEIELTAIVSQDISNGSDYYSQIKKGACLKLIYARRSDHSNANAEITSDQILSYGSSGYSIKKGEHKDNHLIKLFTDLNEIQKLYFIYNKIPKDELSTDFIHKLSKEDIKTFLKLEKTITTKGSGITFNDYRKAYVLFGIEHKVDIDKLRRFIMEFQEKIKKYRPSPTEVFDKIYAKEFNVKDKLDS